MERLPLPAGAKVEAYKPLFRVPGKKIEAILDLTPDLTVFASDDEGQGGWICVFNKHTGSAFRTKASECRHSVCSPLRQ
jgi:hypothetical protein